MSVIQCIGLADTLTPQFMTFCCKYLFHQEVSYFIFTVKNYSYCLLVKILLEVCMIADLCVTCKCAYCINIR